MAKRTLILLLVALSIADVLSTNAALAAPGIAEANPIMAFMQHALGGLWWAPKLVAVPFAMYWLNRYPRSWPSACAVGIYALVVAGNLINAL